MAELPRLPKSFWPVCILALLFNAWRVYDWFMGFGGAAYYRLTGLTETQVAYQTHLPAWTQMAQAIGMMLSVLGSILLVARRRQATVAFALAFVCALVGLVYQNVLSAGGAVLGPLSAVAWIIAAVCAALSLYAARLTRKGLLF